MKEPNSERCRVCIIILGILMYLIIMFPPVSYGELGRIYGVLTWNGDILWSEIFIEIAAALVIAALVYFIYPLINKNHSTSD